MQLSLFSLFIILLKKSANHLDTCEIPLTSSPTIIECLLFFKENNTEETVSHKLPFEKQWGNSLGKDKGERFKLCKVLYFFNWAFF